MSIATEITRLQTAKADLKTAIEGKGVTVPTATKIDGYADLVDSIETGGGGGDVNENLRNWFENNLTEIDLTGVTQIAKQRLRNVKDGKTFTVNAPDVLRLNEYAFESSNKLTAISIPKCTYLGTSCVAGTGISQICIPSVSGLVNSAVFQNCTGLTVADIGSGATQLGGYVFYGCTNLTTIILRNTSVVTMYNATALNNTPFKNGGAGGTIYIPKALYDALGTGTNDYKSATNWSTYDGYGTITWAAIEGSQYENYYADGTPIT